MRRLLLTVPLVILTCGCATVPLLQFTSLTPPLRRNPAAPGLEPSLDSIRVEAQFDRIEGRELLFGFELWNQSSHACEVDPATFEYRVLLPDGREVPGAVAVDPEWKLAVHDQRANAILAAAPKEPGEPSGWQLIGDLLDLLSSGSRTEQEERDRELLRLKEAEEARESRAEHARRLEQLRSERETLVRERMRRTSLPPGQSMTGRIGFPVAPLLSSLSQLEAHGSGVPRVGTAAEVATPGLVLRCRIGNEVRDRGFRIRRY